MAVEKIPFAYSYDDVNPRYRLLHQVNTMFKNKDDPIMVPPLFKLMSILKERFCSSCSLRSLEDNRGGHIDSIDSILDDLKVLRLSNSEQDYITGYHSSTDETFLALNLPDSLNDGEKGTFVLILWRKGRIFTPEDVIIARTCVILFFSLCRETFNSKTNAITWQMNGADVINQTLNISEDQITPQIMSHLYGEALDLVCKCVVITIPISTAFFVLIEKEL